jgi:hypothetical protein
MALRKAFQIGGLHIKDRPGIDHAIGDQPVKHQLPDPRADLRAIIIVVNAGPGHHFTATSPPQAA